jgi:hypothetical protein
MFKVCVHCGGTLLRSATYCSRAKCRALQPPQARSTNPRLRVVIFGLAGIVLLGAILSTGQGDRGVCESKSDAFAMSQEFVRKRLKAPSTASFPWISDRDVGVRYLGDCIHEVAAYVDAQNSFGAMLRSRYYVKLQNEQGTDKWRALHVHLDE